MAGQASHASALVGQAAQPILKNHCFKPGGVVRQRLLEVLRPEEGGIGEPGANHALVACTDLIRVPALDVGDRDECGLQGTRGVFERKILLMSAHRLDQDLGRDREIRLVEMSEDRPWPFD
jgi:hypothetical protein